MLDAGSGIAVGDKARARRFELQIPLRYRADGEGDWHWGTTRNISRSGVLLQGEDWAEPRTPLEMTLLLPKEIIGLEYAAEVVCRGTVTRSERRGNDGGGSLIATRISHYRFVRPQDGRRMRHTSHP
jgi:hypothetical protein